MNELEPFIASPRPQRIEPETPARPRRSDSVKTRALILDAAEALFVQSGFSATSMRAIATRAGVNLAAAPYHFGSKAALLGAVVHRRVEPIHGERIRALDELEAHPEPPDVRAILEAFLLPLATFGPGEALPRLIARLYAEPESISRPLLEQEFGPTMDRFVGALGRALPALDETELRWRFHFVIGSMIHMLAFPTLLVPPSGPATAPPDTLALLLEFAVSGVEQGPASNRPSSNEDVK